MLKTFRIISLILVCLIIFLPLSSFAKQLYIAVITVDGTDTATEGTNSLINVTEFFDMGVGISTIQKLDYTFIEKINFSFNFAVGVDDSYKNYGFKVTYRF